MIGHPDDPPTTEPTPPASASGPSKPSTELPETGVSNGLLAAAAAGFVLIGSALLVVRRRPS